MLKTKNEEFSQEVPRFRLLLFVEARVVYRLRIIEHCDVKQMEEIMSEEMNNQNNANTEPNTEPNPQTEPKGGAEPEKKYLPRVFTDAAPEKTKNLLP